MINLKTSDFQIHFINGRRKYTCDGSDEIVCGYTGLPESTLYAISLKLDLNFASSYKDLMTAPYRSSQIDLCVSLYNCRTPNIWHKTGKISIMNV